VSGRLTEHMIYKVSVRAYENWDRDTLIDELVWLYDNLAKHDKDLYEVLVENYNTLMEEKDGVHS